MGVRMGRAKRALFVGRVARPAALAKIDTALLCSGREVIVAGFCAAFVLGLYMVWKIIRTPGEV